jgi:poly(A) polymerase
VLNQALPDWLNWQETKQLLASLDGHGVKIRFSGGAVRDALLGLAPKDIDAFVDTDEVTLGNIVQKLGFETNLVDLKHGLIKARLNERDFDLLSASRYLMLHGVNPNQYQKSEHWKLAVERYDFTINTIMLSPQGEWFDYFGGVKDLEDGRIRFIRLDEQWARLSPHRLARFMRMHSLYGKELPDVETTKFIQNHLHYLLQEKDPKLSVEMNLLFATPNPYETVIWALDHQIFQRIFGFNVLSVQRWNNLKLIEATLNRRAYPIARLLALAMSADKDAKQAMTGVYERKFLNQKEHAVALSFIRFVNDINPKINQERLMEIKNEMGQAYGSLIVLAWANQKNVLTMKDHYMDMLQIS